MIMSVEGLLHAHGDSITSSATAVAETVVFVGTQKGSLYAWTSNGSSAEYTLVFAKAVHARAIRHIAVSALSQCVATGSDDASIVLLSLHAVVGDALTPPESEDAAASQRRGSPAPCRLAGHTLPITELVWTADGARLVSASYDGRVLVHDVGSALSCSAKRRTDTTAATPVLLLRCIVNSITVGFPVTCMCFGLDETYVFVGGAKVVRVDLEKGNRIAEPGSSGFQLSHSVRWLSAAAGAQSATSGDVDATGVSTMSWSQAECDESAAVTCAIESDIRCKTLTCTSSGLIVAVFAGGYGRGREPAFSVTWRLRSTNWALGVSSTNGWDATAPPNDSVALAILGAKCRATAASVVSPTTRLSSAELRTSDLSWSLGYHSWDRPVMSVDCNHVSHGVLVLCTSRAQSASQEDVQTLAAARKRSREEAKRSAADPMEVALAAARAAVAASQQMCNGLADTLQRLLATKPVA